MRPMSSIVLAAGAALVCAAPLSAANSTPPLDSQPPVKGLFGGAEDQYHWAIRPPGAQPYGQSLAEWSEDYWRWYLTGGHMATEPFRPGRAPLVFMPLPRGEPMSGSGTSEDPIYLKGSLEVTIRAGTSFVLPMFSWTAERYNTGQPDDVPIPRRFIRSVASNLNRDGPPEVTFDGRPVLGDFWQYYVGPRPFDPVVEYPEPTPWGSVAALAFQGVGFISSPMIPGTREVHLLERLTVTNANYPGYPLPIDLGVIYDNTWIIHVVR